MPLCVCLWISPVSPPSGAKKSPLSCSELPPRRVHAAQYITQRPKSIDQFQGRRGFEESGEGPLRQCQSVCTKERPPKAITLNWTFSFFEGFAIRLLLRSFCALPPLFVVDCEKRREIFLGCLFLDVLCSQFGNSWISPLSRYGENERDEGEKLSGKQLLVATFKHMKKYYQILIIPLTFWSGVEQGFFGADFTAVS